jgi:putative spermidine/putrescine transport system ATP-binding protein
MSAGLENVSFAYPGGRGGIDGIDLAIGEGELVAVIGPSGCGKTTALKLIAGFLRPDSGRVTLDGRDATDVPPAKRELGVVFQNYALFAHMRAWENVAYPLKLRGLAAAERRKRAHDMLETVGLSAQADALPAALSGGQQQRVALARALVFRPRALLLDEPLSALDAARRIAMRDEIKRLQRAHGMATLHITHDQEEALSMADRVAVMAEGRVLQTGTPREIYDRPVSRAVASFVGHANLWNGTVLGDGRVRVAIGEIAADTRGFATGAAVAVLARPERVRPVDARKALPGVNVFAGTLAADRFLGSIRRRDLEVSGGRIAVETEGGAEGFAAVHIPPEAAQILPADFPSQPERRPT